MKSELVSFLENYEIKTISYNKCASLRIMMNRYMGASRFLLMFFLFFTGLFFFLFLTSFFSSDEYQIALNVSRGFSGILAFLFVLISYGNNADIGREINKQFNVKFHWYSLPFGLALKLKSNKEFIYFLQESNKKEDELDAEIKNIQSSFYQSNELDFNKDGYSKLNNNLRNVYLQLFSQNIRLFENMEKQNG